MGLIVDTNVFIAFERRGEPVDLSPWEPTEDVFVSVITVSELLTGVHRADTEVRRVRRSAFVEAMIDDRDDVELGWDRECAETNSVPSRKILPRHPQHLPSKTALDRATFCASI